MQILITDLTEMHNGHYCVAGWDVQGARMVRPLPNGANWTAASLQAGGVAEGAIVDVTPLNVQANGAFPHLTEDLIIDPATVHLVQAGPPAWFGAGAPNTYATIDAAFGGAVAPNSVWNNVLQSPHVMGGTNVRSLAGIVVDREMLDFVELFNKLKAVVNDGSAQYQMAVSSEALKTAWRAGGLAGVAAAIPNQGYLHLRIGLARPLQGKCYMMLNGVHW